MSNIDRFGVFLPSFVWEDDGPDRARGIIDFARQVARRALDRSSISPNCFASPTGPG